MADKMKSNIMESVERVFRYLIPGVIFCSLFCLAYPKIYVLLRLKMPASEAFSFLAILSVGMTIYTVQSQIIRFTLEPLAYLFKISPVNIISGNRCLCDYPRSLAKLNLKRSKQKSTDYPKEYYTYLWSMIHYSFILSSTLIFFSFCHEYCSIISYYDDLICLIGVLILLISTGSYIYMQILEKHSTEISL